jgi:hypothetical protein
MRPLGQTRPLLAYGVPAAAGLVAGGALAAQGEDPGSAVLGGLAAGLGARGALGAARLAGKYAGNVSNLMGTAQRGAVDALTTASQNIYAPIKTSAQQVTAQEVAAAEKLNKLRAQMAGESKRAAALGGMAGAIQGLSVPSEAAIANALKGTAAAAGVPLAAGLAGLGGVAAGAIPGALGVPGFQQGMAIDPEGYSSNNTPSAQFGVKSLASTQYV